MASLTHFTPASFCPLVSGLYKIQGEQEQIPRVKV